MHRFFITPAQRAGRMVYFDDEQAYQMRRVLRLRPGERVLALDGRGQQVEVLLEEVSNSRASGRVAAESAAAAGEPHVRLTLFQSLLPREKFEWVLQKGTEIGVAAFVPVITRRSLVRDAEAAANKLERWRRIIREAAEQSGRGVLPRLADPIPFETAATDAASHAPALIAWEEETERTLRHALDGRRDTATVALFIGPEGGYEAAEVAAATRHDAIPITLGRRVLRTETAAIVGAALVLHELGEMG